MSYIALKHLHTTAAVLSLLFFVVRACWAVAGSPRLQARFVRIAPHVIDTILLLCGLAMAAAIGFGHGWLHVKIAGLGLYIVVGSYANKQGPTPGIRAGAAILAVLIFAYIAGVAITKQPLSWFA